MTATAVAPVRSPRPDRSGGGPRLLLPPSPEPKATPLAVLVGGALAGRGSSVLSPLTDRHWPLPAPATPEPSAKLPDPRQICGAVVLAAVEVLRGARPLAQLTRWVTPEVLDALAEAATPALPDGRRPRAVVRGMRVCRISPDVAEGSVVIHDGPRVRAAAVRLEAHRGGWRAAVLQIG